MTPDAGELRRALAGIEPLAARAPDAVRVARAPGRVNLIGEHTDYNLGLVLPMSIDLEIAMAFVATDDRRVEVTLLAAGERCAFDLDDIGPPTGSWIDYLRGTAASLTADGAALRGLRGVLGSTLPMSAGLSSSAALELCAALALLEDGADGRAADRLWLARVAQRAEHAYVGVNSGLMDQLASALGLPDAALLIDCRSLEWRPVPLALDEVAVVAIDSGSPRRLDASDYNVRRAECEAAVAALAANEPRIASLRDVDAAMLERIADRLDPVLARRVEHVVRENERVTDCVAALEARDLDAVRRLFAESHASLRDLFEVSSPELDALVEIAGAVDGVVGARMTGGGFGGSTVNLVRRDAVDDLRAAVGREYPARTGFEARVMAVEPAPAASVS